MEDFELEKYGKVVSEIDSLKKGIERYLHSGAESVGDMSYAHALKRLSNLRALQRMTPKKVRERYAKSKFPSSEEVFRNRVKEDSSRDT
jgi:hypothetical protein